MSNADDFFDFMHPLTSFFNPDASSQTEITFKGKDYLLIGDMEGGGAIATKEQYESGKCSYAHLFSDGFIRRFNEVIGTKDEITIKETTNERKNDDLPRVRE